MTERHLGSYEEVARTLSEVTGQPYTRQGVHQMWKRRKPHRDKAGRVRPGNGFPDRHEYNISGHLRLLFNVDEVIEWKRNRDEHPDLRNFPYR